MSAPIAGKLSFSISYAVIAAFDIDRLTIDQRIGNRMPGALDNASKGCPGNAHPFARILMGQALQISQADCFPLINRQINFVQFQKRYAAGLEIADIGVESNDSVFLWSRHTASL